MIQGEIFMDHLSLYGYINIQLIGELLFELCVRQDRQIRMWMRELNETGRYKLDEEPVY